MLALWDTKCFVGRASKINNFFNGYLFYYFAPLDFSEIFMIITNGFFIVDICIFDVIIVNFYFKLI